jgi:hypothetical protein
MAEYESEFLSRSRVVTLVSSPSSEGKAPVYPYWLPMISTELSMGSDVGNPKPVAVGAVVGRRVVADVGAALGWRLSHKY